MCKPFWRHEQLTVGAPWRIRLTNELRTRFSDEAPPDYFTMYQTMRRLGVSRQTVWVKRGELEALYVTRGRHTQNGGGFPDRHQLALGRFGRWPETWDFPMTAQITDSVGVKTMTICAGSALPIENAGDDSVRIISRQTPHERDRILVCPHDGDTAAANRASFR
jgi:hypothetical protein